jgi:Holliday junction DNA helicase RuvB
MFREKFLAGLRESSSIERKVQKVEIFAPQNFDEYVGQNSAKDIVKIIIEAAKIEHRNLPNVMVDGPYGTGKTTLARLVLRGYNGRDGVLDAASVNRTLPTKGTIVIDEIHNLNSEVADSLNVILDQGQLSIIGCTTNPGALSSAFRSRFRSVHLEPYSVKDIETILRHVTERKGYIPTDQLSSIAARSRFNPRTGLNYLATIFDWMAVNTETIIHRSLVDEVFIRLGVDRLGYTKRDKEYLAAIPEDRAVGIQYISAVTSIDTTTIESEIEPYLMQTGLIDRTSRGRVKLGEIE